MDRPGVRVAVGKGSAYDLFLSRELRNAEIVRAPTSPAVVDSFLAMGLEVAAGVRQQLESDAQRLPGLRLLPDRFMVIQQAMGLPKGHGSLATSLLGEFVEDVKARAESIRQRTTLASSTCVHDGLKYALDFVSLAHLSCSMTAFSTSATEYVFQGQGQTISELLRNSRS